MFYFTTQATVHLPSNHWVSHLKQVWPQNDEGHLENSLGVNGEANQFFRGRSQKEEGTTETLCEIGNQRSETLRSISKFTQLYGSIHWHRQSATRKQYIIFQDSIVKYLPTVSTIKVGFKETSNANFCLKFNDLQNIFLFLCISCTI